MKIRTLIYGLLTLAAPACAQDDAMMASMQQRFGLYTERAVQEKMYVHIDRPFYLVGETIWFKAYNLNGATHRFLDLSKVGYLEVLDSENNAVLQTKFSMVDGRGNGSALVPSTLVSGKYKVRCYTSWMKNFSADSYFETNISILNPFVRFDPDKASKEETRYDVQFFPEGGHLVNGIESKVAFRAVGVDGKGIKFKGALLNQQNETVREFEPEMNGIGYFSFKPEGNAVYKAAITDGKGKRFEYEFPKVEPQGFVMEVKDSTAALVKVTVTAKVDADGPGNVYMLTHTRQANAFFGKKAIGGGKAVFVLEKAKMGEGVSQITIFNEKLKPVCERLYFKRPEKQLTIDAQVGKSFTTREKVSMNVTAGLGQALPAWSSLSVAVYLDDSIQYQPQQDIHSYLWLTADLKGNIENPGYYFSSANKDTDRQLDNLMLTHGWRRLKWDKVFGGQLVSFEHLPEYDGHFIHARLLNKADGTPAKNKDAFLGTLDVPARLYVDRSDENGRVKFEVRQFTGPKEITLQTDLANDTTYRFEVANPFSKQFSTNGVPNFYFDKALENQLLTRSINMQTANAFLPRVYAEKKAVLTDSLPFFGMPDEKYFLDDFTRFPTMEEVLREYVKGVLVRRRQKEFHLRMIDKLVPNTYYTTDPLMLLDGIPVFDADKIIEMDPLKIKKIELLSSRYFLGPMTFTGIVSFSTYRGDLGGFELDPKVLVMPYEGVQAQREFYAPRYDNNNANSRIADFRNLLHWAPNVTTGKDGKATVEFYTSDQTGRYQVVIQGITPEGTAGSQTVSFDVKKRSL
ncbi:hypothetical protein GCM10010967_04370 [Dyadobacter beijingensis]|uniref:MG2 domain-containing protein n=1 Tax=Dyadobacter beijingensis TaxID=365489 RepID=A0ABQ2HCV9_9BACT|nr:hypothetical protein [Dyadobacter beijingensis]GGM75921.1 hypothetical protein GCM10010967_04370 [Dyadobacter beijingensis]